MHSLTLFTALVFVLILAARVPRRGGCARDVSADAPPGDADRPHVLAQPVRPLRRQAVGDDLAPALSGWVGQVGRALRLTPVTGSRVTSAVAVVIVQRRHPAGRRRSPLPQAVRRPSARRPFVPTTTGPAALRRRGADLRRDGGLHPHLQRTAGDVRRDPSPAAPPPPARPPLAVVVATGCTTCHPGDTLGFELHVTNPGAPMLVELKTGARLPGGGVVSILGRHEEEILHRARR